MVNWKEYTDDRKRRFCNLHLTCDMESDDITSIPVIHPFTKDIPKHYIPFNQAIGCKKYNQCVHFFIDDYQFERFWNTPEKYIQILKNFDSVISPDFSVYLDVPMSVNVWNIYRSRLLANVMQRNGIPVIPNISVVPKELYDVVFSGLPESDLIAFNNMCVPKGGYLTNWFSFVREAIKRLNPKRVLIYGKQYTISSHQDVTYIENETIKRLRT